VRVLPWLDDVVSGRVTTVAELCAREKNPPTERSRQFEALGLNPE
jgi:hypothetical protein